MRRPFFVKLAEQDRWFRPAINMDDGKLHNQPVADAHQLETVSL